MIKFYKYQGLGNDFIIIGSEDAILLSNYIDKNKLNVSKICNRNFGLGANGLILSLPSKTKGNTYMRIINSDGTEAEMCGNGIRCLIKYYYDTKSIMLDQSIEVETLSGLIYSHINSNKLICVNMGLPVLDSNLIPTKFQKIKSSLPEGKIFFNDKYYECYSVGMGNPHLIIIVDSIIDVNLELWGPLLENNKNFPSKTNVHFVEIIDVNRIKIIVWERGCGPTLACGTGACACVVATYLLGLTDRQVKVKLPGGLLDINWTSKQDPVLMTGAADLVYEGRFDYEEFLIK